MITIADLTEEQLAWAGSFIGRRFTSGHAGIVRQECIGWLCATRKNTGVWLVFAGTENMIYRRYPRKISG